MRPCRSSRSPPRRPTAEQAARLANAAGTGLRDYLRSVAGAQNVPAARQVVV